MGPLPLTSTGDRAAKSNGSAAARATRSVTWVRPDRPRHPGLSLEPVARRLLALQA